MCVIQGRWRGPVVRASGFHSVDAGSNPVLASSLDWFSVVSDSTLPRFINSHWSANWLPPSSWSSFKLLKVGCLWTSLIAIKVHFHYKQSIYIYNVYIESVLFLLVLRDHILLFFRSAWQILVKSAKVNNEFLVGWRSLTRTASRGYAVTFEHIWDEPTNNPSERRMWKI